MTGGPKLVAIDLDTDTVARTNTLPRAVHYSDSYMDDLRLDMRANALASKSGHGSITGIVDSSNEGRNGFVIIDLATGES